MRQLALAVGLGLSLLATGCAHKKPPPPPPPAPVPATPPLIAFESAKLDEVRFSGAAITFQCRVENPNPFPVSVGRVRFGLQLEGRPAGGGELDAPFAIPAAGPDGAPGRGALTIPVLLRFGAIPGFAQVMAKEKEADYALSGAVAFRTPGGVVEVPLAYAGTMPVPRLPKTEVLRLTMRAASKTEVLLELRIRLGNTSVFPIPSARLDYGLFVGKKEVARASGRLEAPLAPGESAELTVPIRISVLKVGEAAARFLIPFASMKVELKGRVEFDGVPVPLDLDAEVVPEKEEKPAKKGRR